MIRLCIGILVGLGIALQYRQYAIVAFAIVGFILLALLVERWSIVWHPPSEHEQPTKKLPRRKV